MENVKKFKLKKDLVLFKYSTLFPKMQTGFSLSPSLSLSLPPSLSLCSHNPRAHVQLTLACFVLIGPSIKNGVVTTPTVNIPSSLAALEIIGAAPVPVPPPKPSKHPKEEVFTCIPIFKLGNLYLLQWKANEENRLLSKFVVETLLLHFHLLNNCSGISKEYFD